MPEYARTLRRLLLNLTYPASCACCQQAIEAAEGVELCAVCRASLIRPRAACTRCASLLPSGTSGDPCPRCKTTRLQFARTVCLGSYEDSLRSAVLRTKRPFDRPLAVALAGHLATNVLQEFQSAGIDVVIPVPMHWSRRISRGVNCPDALADAIAQRLQVPTVSHLLVRCRRTLPQANLSPRRRKANVRGAFALRMHEDLIGARVLLVDDILTTGATLNEAAKTLRKAGAGDVYAAVLARAEGPF